MNRPTYMLRRNLPLWKSEETIGEVVKYCLKYDIDEVIWKIDPEEFSCGFPRFDKIKEYVKTLKCAKKALEKSKIKFSINPWLTLGHADRGRDMRKIFRDMSFFVDWKGKTCKACACPLSKGWQKWIIEAYKLYASSYPYILWLEDDFRNFNHQPCDYGCFCDIHVEEFSRIIRQETSRQDIVRAILKPGHPHPWRKKWFDMLGKVMVDVSGKIEIAVHKVSPDTRLGLMCSDPDDHALEGRNWSKLYQKLAGRHRPVSRPSMGYYGMSNPMDFFNLANGFKKTISTLPEGTRKCAELENSRYTRFSKSVKFTKIQVAIGFFAGADDMTLNLFDMLGTPILQEEGYLKMLKEVKPYFAEITDITANTLETGIGLLYNPRQSDNIILKDNAVYADLKPSGCGWAYPLQACGISTTYNKSKSVAVTGQILRSFPGNRIKDILSGGVLLDASGSETLCDMGYERYLGAVPIRTFCKTDEALSAEELIDTETMTKTSKYMTLSYLTPSECLCEFRVKDKASILSQIIGVDRRYTIPGMVTYTNSLGGRVAQYPFDISRGVRLPFLNWHRYELLGKVSSWISGNEGFIQAKGGPYVLTFRRDGKNQTVLFVLNLAHDDIKEISFDIGFHNTRGIKRLEVLEHSGRCVTVKFKTYHFGGNLYRIDTNIPLKSMDFKIFKILLV